MFVSLDSFQWSDAGRLDVGTVDRRINRQYL